MLDAKEELTESFDKKLKYWHTVQTSGPAEEGWQVKDKKLRVDKGPNYSPNVVTQAFAPFDTDGKSSILLDLSMVMETEDGR